MAEPLTASAVVKTPTSQRYAKQLGSHLERFGQRGDLHVQWQRSAAA